MMRSLSRLVASLVVLTVPAAVATAQQLPSDPSLTTGQLDNGLQYIVKKNSIPPGHASIWVHIHSGSLNETDRQRGLAHYLEHMAFNGSANFAPGSLVPFFQSLGMTFGRDQNAFTNMSQTTYQLTLPDTKPETLGKGMTFFADVVGRLSLLPKEIDDERQIIQEERRRGLSGRQRTSSYILEHITPGSLYGERDTIGKEETINNVNEQDFKDYYGQWYGASNATVIVVADTDPSEVVKAIKDKFSDLPKKSRPTPQDLKIRAYDKSFAIVASDPEVRSEEVQIVRLEPAHAPTTTIPMYRADLVTRLGTQALNRRLSDKVSAGGTSYLNARVSTGNDSNAIYTAEISGRAAPGKWKETLNEIALELQRARAFGFSAREIEDAKKEMMSGAERAVQTEATSTSASLIARINGSVAQAEPTMSPQQHLDVLKQTLPGITPEEVGAKFAAEFEPKAVAFIATLPTGPSVPSESELLDLGLKALQVKPTQESEAAHATTLMDKLPAGGKVAEGAEHAASKVWSGWLSNNVRVHYRFMDERKNQASISIDLIGGEMFETADNRGITSAATLAWSRPSTKHLTSTDIRELMTGKKVNVRGGGFGGGGGRGGRGGGGGGGSSDSIALNISGSPEELESGFQLAYLLLTEPKIEQASFEQYKITAKQMLQESLKNPASFGARAASAAIYPASEARVQPLAAEQIDKLTLPAAQAWLEKLIKESPIEVVVIGDIKQDTAMALVAKYLGSLASRERVSESTYASFRKMQRPAGARIVNQSVETPTDQAFVMNGFYGADQSNRDDAHALSMAARVLSTRMIKEVREEAQLVYSISASSRAATTYPGFGVFGASATCQPAKAKLLSDKLASMYAAFAKDGPTADELGVAKKQMANTYDEQMRDPGYWSGRVQQSTFRGVSMDDIVNEPAAYQALTPEQVKAVFAKYSRADSALSVIVMPVPPKDGQTHTTEPAEKKPSGGVKRSE